GLYAPSHEREVARVYGESLNMRPASTRSWRRAGSACPPSVVGFEHIRHELLDDVPRRAVVPDHVPRAIGRLRHADAQLVRGLPNHLREMTRVRTKPGLVEVIVLDFVVPGVHHRFWAWRCGVRGAGGV